MGADNTSVTCQEYDLGHCAGLVFAAQVVQYLCSGSGESTGAM